MKKLTAFFLFWFCFLFARADTFVVTSSADSGPGTLREAVTQANANGTAVADFIHFNIPQTSFNLRIINLENELPSLTSNITIDGTTQPGERYAMTDARICLKKNEYAPSFSMLKIENAQHVKIYGLYLYYGYWQGFFGNPYRSNYLYGINLINANNIEIGAVGKGNVINGVVHGIYSNSDSCLNIIIQSNYIGHGRYYTNSTEDIDENVLAVDACITFAQVKDITIGGSQPGEGNVFGSPRRGINIDTKYTTGNGFIKIRNNIFGRGFDKQSLIKVYDFWDSYINIGRSRNNPSDWSSEHSIDYRVELLDNDIPNHVRFNYISDSIIVQRNKFEQDLGITSGSLPKLNIWQCSRGGIIGDAEPANANSFQKGNPDNYFSSVVIYESGPFTILKNVFDCNSVYGSTTLVSHYNNTIPFVQVDVTTPDSVMGHATPKTRIDLYYDDPCTACEGRIYIAYVMADTAGRWKYAGPITGTVVATATNSLGATSQFSTPQFNTDSMKVKQPTCGKDNGSITGIKTEGADTYFWIRHRYPQKDTVSRTVDLLNAGWGEYILYAVHGGTCINTINQSIVLEDKTPQIQTSWTTVSQPSCGRFNGYIGGLAVYNGQYSAYKWIDNQEQTIGTQNYINTLGPGTYRFVVTDTTFTGGCSDTATFVLTNQSGPSLSTDSIRITNAVCSRNGSIINIRASNVTGTPFIRWLDSLNNSVGNSLDLLNVPPGKYYLKFKDAGGCDTIVTPFYTIGNTGGIIIDTSDKSITPAKCSGNTGSIQHITVTGGSTYEWKNATTGVVVGNTLPVNGLAAGSYQLTANNSYGCSQTSPVIILPQSGFLSINVTAWGSKAANCGKPNGIIEAQQLSRDTSLYSFQWLDSTTGQNAGSFTRLQNIYGGTYLLFATDSNGCRQQLLKATITNLPLPYFDYSALQITPDQCLAGQGAIRNLVVNDMAGGNGTYAWLNGTNDSVGNTLNIRNLPQGTYQLKATDLVGCTVISRPLPVDNLNVPLPPPQYDDQTILKNTSATLIVRNNRTGTYRLYNDPLAAAPIQENTTGLFTTPVLHADKVYYIRYVNGICESNLTAVQVKVVDKTAVYVPTAFTPNGDGKNDVLKATAYGRIRLLNFSIYNRWGQAVFATSNFNSGWNGTVNGKSVDTGVFVWVIKAMDEITGQSIEQKGTVILIH